MFYLDFDFISFKKPMSYQPSWTRVYVFKKLRKNYTHESLQMPLKNQGTSKFYQKISIHSVYLEYSIA